MYSSQTLVSDGTVNRVDLSIEYLSKTDIQVYVDDALLPTSGYAWTWASDTAINFNQAVRLGSVINIRRATAYDTIKHIFEVGGAVFKDRNVDENFRQVLYWCQDFIEGKSIKDVWNNLNMHGFRIMNLGNAIDPYDAVSLGQYQSDAMGAWQAKYQTQTLKDATDQAALNAYQSERAAAGHLATLQGSILDAATALEAAQHALNIAASGVVIIESVADLRTYTLPNPAMKRIHLKSYHKDKFEGGGEFIVDYSDKTSIDNGGTVIVNADGVRFKRESAEVGSYFDFGARVDGVTNDYDAFINTHKVFKKTNLPHGIMLINVGIDIDLFMNGQQLDISITGEGTSSSYIKFNSTTRGFYSASNRFFRGLNFKNFTIQKSGSIGGIGIYIGSAGAEQINIENVQYQNWHIGRATHQWNSNFKSEKFSDCNYPYATYGTSSDTVNCYANRCKYPYMLGYACTPDGTLSVPSLPYAYSTLSGHAADDCGEVGGSVYKLGNCAGITLNSMGAERVKGNTIFDATELVVGAYTNVAINNFAFYLSSSSPNLTSIIKQPVAIGNSLFFNNLSISADREISIISGNGNGVTLNNPRMNNRAFSQITTEDSQGIVVDGIAMGASSSSVGELGLQLTSNGVTFKRVKRKQSTFLFDMHTQKITLNLGSTSQGLSAGLIAAIKLDFHPVRKGALVAGATNRGTLMLSLATDYAAADINNFILPTYIGNFPNPATVNAKFENGQFLIDVVFTPSTNPTVRHVVNLDMTYNGIENVNKKYYTVSNK